MVACYHNLLTMGLRSQPVKLSLNLPDGSSIGEVAGMDQDIAWRDRHYVCVRVR
jgi:hypothetical protein